MATQDKKKKATDDLQGLFARVSFNLVPAGDNKFSITPILWFNNEFSADQILEVLTHVDDPEIRAIGRALARVYRAAKDKLLAAQCSTTVQ
jgi:hypothetical protein